MHQSRSNSKLNMWKLQMFNYLALFGSSISQKWLAFFFSTLLRGNRALPIVSEFAVSPALYISPRRYVGLPECAQERSPFSKSVREKSRSDRRLRFSGSM